MIKIVVLICQVMAPMQCTPRTAQAMVMGDHPDESISCKALGAALLKEVHVYSANANTIMVACQKDGKAFY